MSWAIARHPPEAAGFSQQRSIAVGLGQRSYTPRGTSSIIACRSASIEWSLPSETSSIHVPSRSRSSSLGQDSP